MEAKRTAYIARIILFVIQEWHLLYIMFKPHFFRKNNTDQAKFQDGDPKIQEI